MTNTVKISKELTALITKARKGSKKKTPSKKVQQKTKVSPDSEMKILYLDIENAPAEVLAWDLWGINVPISSIRQAGGLLCYAAQWDHDPNVIFDSIENKSMKEMITGLWALLDEADAVVTYNGKRFDIPKIGREFQVLGITPPSRFQQIDLFPIMKATAKHLSHKLDFVSAQLNIGQKVHNEGMPLWVGCMNNERKHWKNMEKYNIQDTKLLKKLYKPMRPWIHAHPNVGLYNIAAGKKLTSLTCDTCGSDNLSPDKSAPHHITRTQMYNNHVCNACGSQLRERTTCVPKDQRKFLTVSHPLVS